MSNQNKFEKKLSTHNPTLNLFHITILWSGELNSEKTNTSKATINWNVDVPSNVSYSLNGKVDNPRDNTDNAQKKVDIVDTVKRKKFTNIPEVLDEKWEIYDLFRVIMESKIQGKRSVG